MSNDGQDTPPLVEKFERPEKDGLSPFSCFLAAAVSGLVAILCFTPVWDLVAPQQYRSEGRRAGFSNLIFTLGPGGIAAIAAGIAVICALVGWWALARQRSMTDGAA